ncbi:unnamed protein product [Symbiodinium sp. KB8]|nr:unnamed protein product [Symbiodinium sp. KB8]
MYLEEIVTFYSRARNKDGVPDYYPVSYHDVLEINQQHLGWDYLLNQVALKMPYCEYGATRCFGVSKGADVVDNQAYLLFGRLQFPYFDVENVIEAGWAAIFGPGVFIPETPPGSAKPKFKDKEKEKGVEMCRYFMKPSGCKRGSRFVYSPQAARLPGGETSVKGTGHLYVIHYLYGTNGGGCTWFFYSGLTGLNGVETVLKVKSGCPQLQEVEALSLIARIEERKREHLENETLVLQDKVEVASMLMEKTWEDHLWVYAQDGKMGDGLRALRDAPFLEDMPCECLCGLVPADVEDSGWEILKELSFLNRSQRRRLLLAKRWVVHLFAGEPGHWEVFKLDQHGTVVLELDIHRCRGQDIYRTEVWRALVWAACMGKIDVVMGGPPGRQRGSFGHDGVLPDDLRPLSAITRMV